MSVDEQRMNNSTTEKAADEKPRNIVFTAGSVLRGDDAAGPLLAKLLDEDPADGWEVIDGGQTPEDDLGYIRDRAPERILFVDASKMGLLPGMVRQLSAEDVAESFLITTHSLPISFLLKRLYEVCNDVTFLGIQVASTEFFDPVTPEVRHAVEDIARRVRQRADFSDYEHIQ